MPISITGSNGLAHYGAGAARTYPQSMLVWMRVNSATMPGDVYATFRQSGTAWLLMFSTQSNNSANVGLSTSWGASTSNVSNGAAVVLGSSLVPVLIVAASSTDYTLYTPSYTRSFAPSNPNAWEATNCRELVVGPPGHYAEIASWNSALTAGDWTTLAGGAAPETVSPGTLYDCWDLNPAGTAGSAAPTSYTGRVNSQVMNVTTSATISSYAHPVTRAPIPTLTGSVTLDNMAPTGSMLTQPLSSMNGTVTLDEMLASGSLGLQPGAINSEPFKNWSGTLQAGVTIPKVAVVRISDMVTVLNLTNQTTNGSGVLSITSSAMVPGVRYLLVTCDAAGTAFGAEPYTAV